MNLTRHTRHNLVGISPSQFWSAVLIRSPGPQSWSAVLLCSPGPRSSSAVMVCQFWSCPCFCLCCHFCSCSCFCSCFCFLFPPTAASALSFAPAFAPAPAPASPDAWAHHGFNRSAHSSGPLGLVLWETRDVIGSDTMQTPKEPRTLRVALLSLREGRSTPTPKPIWLQTKEGGWLRFTSGRGGAETQVFCPAPSPHRRGRPNKSW